jgi:hypothetical protein
MTTTEQQPSGAITSPVTIQRIEGAVLLLAGVVGWISSDLSWWWFALLLLVPDVSMVGYLVNTKVGAAVYNLGHSLVGPGLLLGWAWLEGPHLALALGSVWLAHVGMDRMFGYGLKYDDAFKHTHLGWIGGGQG